ncbi:hypothetical protein PENTCL1PPCAC_15407, partial [Pristionchus entomophagus]
RNCIDANSRRVLLSDASSPSNFYRHMRKVHPEIYLSDSARNENFGELLATAVSVNLIPFNVIDSPEMRNVFRFLDEKIKIPSRRTISTK